MAPASGGVRLALPADPAGTRPHLEGWLWTGLAWPSRFEVEPPTADPAPPDARRTGEWYIGRPLAPHPNPPSAPSNEDRVWRVASDVGEVGFLIRGSGLLRWEVHAERIVAGSLPDERLVLELHPWPLPDAGAWYGTVGLPPIR